ncbi:MAG TPA: KpsF/GutQ family sugar-phosphate isomerase [Bacteroidales bacterium]|nr:KpsF/GutQ family sugar-phosphate isomerase [Bacteroidales bacterium]
MKTKEQILEIALRTINEEVEAASGLRERLDEDLAALVDRILASNGRLIVTGIGKSAIIAQKIVATLNSTGTPAIFMHAADAIHGDLGIVQPEDIVLCLSKSGNTPEIKVLVPLIRSLGNTLAAMVGNRDSYLARQADLILDTTVDREACPNNLAPTSSTTAQLVMGDVLAVCLLEARGFSQEDFARYHPGGALGKRLYLRVEDVFTVNEAPRVDEEDDIRKVIVEITSRRLGATAVMKGESLSGVITDGDLRRMMMKFDDFTHMKAADIMTRTPRTIPAETLVADALNLMKASNITQLLVTREGRYAGVIHLHDILREGLL